MAPHFIFWPINVVHESTMWFTKQCGSRIQRKDMVMEYPGRNGKHSQTNEFFNFRVKGRI